MDKKEISIITVGILIFDDVEVLDFAGPFEVFSVARYVGEHNQGKKLFQVVTIAQTQKIVSATGGLLIKPTATTDNHPPLDILIVPGGWGTRKERTNIQIINWITTQNKNTKITASVCTGAFLLAESGLLDGKQATTHWNSIPLMKQRYPKVTVTDNKRFIDEGHIITSAGISAGIDMSLSIVSRIYGEEVAKWTAKRMEYNFIL